MAEDFEKLEPLLKTLAQEYIRCEPQYFGSALTPGSPRGEEILGESRKLAQEHGFHPQNGLQLMQDYVADAFKELQAKLKPEMIRFQEIRHTLLPKPGGVIKPFAHAVPESKPFIDAVAKMQAEGFTAENAHKFVYSEIMRQKVPAKESPRRM